MKASVLAMDTGVLQQVVDIVEKAQDKIPPCPR
jgi:hypothetical protein